MSDGQILNSPAIAPSTNPTSVPLPEFLTRKDEFQLGCDVHLPDFEGPLDLLLFLIKSHEMDIMNLSVSKITAQYLDYLNYMRTINIDIASEYLVMAATLTFLKSQELLPQEAVEEKTGPDPKKALIEQLLRLRCYKDLARMMESRVRLFRDVYPCRNTGLEDIEDGLEPEVALSNTFQLQEAMAKLIERRRQVTHKIVFDDVPVIDCMKSIVEKLKFEPEVPFQRLLPTLCRPSHVVATFLGILEMTKLQLTTIRQNEPFDPIYVGRKMNFDDFEAVTQKFSNLEWE